MTQQKQRRKAMGSGAAGPVIVGSPLFRLLELVARQIAARDSPQSDSVNSAERAATMSESGCHSGAPLNPRRNGAMTE